MTPPHRKLPTRIVLGVSGGIAAYKAPDLVRRLRERGAEVQVVMTAGASQFVSPLTFQAVSHRPVRAELWDRDGEMAMGHLELARWAELVIIAPATAGLLARLALGHADDLLTTLCLATTAPVVVAPAMNHVMWDKAATQANMDKLREHGVRVLGPAKGALAEGESGAGRMLEPLAIAEALLPGVVPQALVESASVTGLLDGETVLITAGPTREAIDPVRFVSNRSSGRMGFALAAAAAEAGARVVLVAGPVQLPTPAGVTRFDVESAAEMHATVLREVGAATLFIGAAAVADYAPRASAPGKIKKDAPTLTLELERTPDILGAVAAREPRPFCVGFAAETDELEQHARQKLARKRLDLICANWVGAGRGFDQPDNAVTAYWADGQQAFAVAPKPVLARDLIRLIAERKACTPSR
jgi:phosphopantothenoylcysteine decarboxylase/phosphopantothenate--cysteine ligase